MREELHDHCVLGREGKGRTWSTEAGATAYAKDILARNARDPRPTQIRLFVVKIVKVIELATPPMIERAFRPEDLE